MTHTVQQEAPPPAAAAGPPPRGGKQPRTARRATVTGKVAGVFGGGILYLVVGVLVLPPLGFLVYGAFRSGPPGSDAHFTLDNVQRVFASSASVTPLLNTIKLSLLVAVLSVVIGAVLAYLVTRTNVPFARAWELLISIPFYLSPTVLTLSIVAALGEPGYADPILKFLHIQSLPSVYSFFGVTVVLTIWMTSYAFLFFRGPMQGLNAELTEAARSLGAGFWRATFTVQARMLLPALMACGVMIFALVAETFSVPAILGSQTYPTIATDIYFATTYYPAQSNLAAAYALLLLLVSGVGLAIFALISRNAQRYVSTGGKARTAPRINLGAWRWLVAAILFVYVMFVTVGSIVSLVLASLQPFISSTIENLSLDNYRTVIDDNGFTALRNTLVLAILASVLVLLLGFGVSYVRRFTKLPGRATAEFIASITIAIPGLALGIGMLWAYINLPATIYGSIWILLIGYVARWGSQGVRLMDAGLAPISGDLNDAARSLGAGTARRMRTIFAPLVTRSIGSGLIVVFILVVNELPVTIFLYSPKSETLSVQLFNSLAMSGASQAAVYGVVLVALTLVLAPFILLGGRGSDKATAVKVGG